ncbi:MAG: type-F conjugative transfer system secretin TraK [Proteobacteria bacterium]|nr:type-F conjugative transfer system secretin TraK [Pseudomonadota bacterium]MBU1649868.1 type-F conjugative transfer system secretin TraK [Pseudomonadota bacterium]
MRKILRLSLCLLLAASSVQAEEKSTPVPPVPSVAPEPTPKEEHVPALKAPMREQAPDLKDQTSILPKQDPVVIEPKPIKPTKDSTAAFDEPVPVSFIAAEMPTIVQLSNRDINRIVCSGPMSDLIFSEEKGVTGHFSGNSAFIKFKAEEMNGELLYAETPSELFVVCNGAVYTLIAEPHEIPSVTLHLAAPAKDVFQKNIDHYKNLPLEKQVLQIIREGYEGGYPSSYKVSNADTLIPLCGDLSVNLLQTVDVEGVGLRLKQYKVVSTKGETMELQEKTFLSLGISESILAVAIEDHVLNTGEATRVFVVEKREQSQ